MGYALSREPRAIPPGGKSTISLDINDGQLPLKDTEVKFEFKPKDVGKIEPAKIKTDASGNVKSVFFADSKLKKDLDVLVSATWKQGESENNCKILIEVRKKAKS